MQLNIHKLIAEMDDNLLAKRKTWYSSFVNLIECEPLEATYLGYFATPARSGPQQFSVSQ